jgi:hypothetical protein
MTVAANLRGNLPPGRVRFLTLTYRSTTEDLKTLVQDLFKGFVRLRRSPDWKKRVVGGVSFLEVKWNSQPQRWHAHLHTLIEGTYFPQPLLSRAWRAATNTSYIVDIRAIANTDHALAYVTKYATKAVDNETTLHPAQLDEAVLALRGTRTMTTFGTWRRLGLTKHLTETGFVALDTLQNILDAARAGDAYARGILSCIRRYSPWTTTQHQLPPTRPPPPSN